MKMTLAFRKYGLTVNHIMSCKHGYSEFTPFRYIVSVVSFLDRSCGITEFIANQVRSSSHLSVLTQMKYICNYLV